MSKKARNTFIGGMDMDSAKSKSQPTKFYKGKNIKVITEEGLSTGNIENEDGTKLSFKLPSLAPVMKIQFANVGEPVSDTLSIIYKDPTTSTLVSVNVTAGDIETLFKELNTVLVDLVSANQIKFVNSGSYITMITYGDYDDIIRQLQSTTNILVLTAAPEITDLKIIGWTTLREEIVLFTTDCEDEIPSGSTGQIWKFSYNLSTNEIDNINDGVLDPYYHLMYNNILNFSTQYHIGTEAIGHYENSKTGRVYWTDEYNHTRVANLFDPDLIGMDPGALSIAADFIPSIPVVTNITGGGNIQAGSVVQYCYRLSRTGGQFTPVSPLTNPYPLGIGNPTSNTVGNRSWEYWGGITGSYSGHAITYDIKNIDTRFNVIEHIAVVTNGNGTNIYKFAEESVPQDGNLTVVHANTGLNIQFTPEEFSAIRRTFVRCKTLAVKDKRLIVGNLNLGSSSVDDFDARAYRFNENREAKLTDREREDITINGTTKEYTTNPAYTWLDIPSDFDAVNPFNKSKYDSYYGNPNDYKYQADGNVLGGEGPNIKYQFTTREFESKDTIYGFNPAGGYKALGTNRITQNERDTTLLNGEKVLIVGDHRGFKGTSVSANFTGYARGEVYRFGITFYDLAGNPYETKWIGDIKFPDTNDYFTRTAAYNQHSEFVLQKLNGNALNLVTVGIQFDIDISSVKTDITGFEIVRVERPLQDRTRLGTGVLVPFTGNVLVPRRSFRTANNYGVNNITDYNKAFITSASSTDFFTALTDTPWCNTTVGDMKTFGFISPITYFDVTGDHFNVASEVDSVTTIGYVHQRYEGGTSYFSVMNSAIGLPNKGDLSVLGNIVSTRCFKCNGNTRESRSINKGQLLYPGQVLISGGGYYTGRPGDSIWNASFSTKDNRDNSTEGLPAAYGCQKGILEIDSPFTFYSQNNNTSPSANSNQLDPADDSYAQWRLVSYDRELPNQYGGDTYEARTYNTYISTGAFKQVVPTTLDNITSFTVFGGDVYTQYFASNYFYYRNDGSTGNAKYQLGFGYPCETPINVDYQSYLTSRLYGAEAMQRDWQNIDGSGLAGTTLIGQTDNYYSGFYSKNNDSKLIYFPKGFLEDYPTEFPHRLWASEKKLDGELYDSWREFLPNTYSEVEGMYGQINKIITERDLLLYYQDVAMGVAAVNDRTSVPSEDGSSIVLGKGGILDHYQYLSRKTGTKHKFSVVPGSSGIHHFDSNLMKWFTYGQGVQPISDVKGIHSLFNKFNGRLLSSDRILKGRGIHGTYDRVRNKVYMTFLDAQSGVNTPYTALSIITNTASSYLTIEATDIGKNVVFAGDTVKITGSCYLSLSTGLTQYYFNNQEYTVVSVNSKDSITIDLGFSQVLSFVPQTNTDVIVYVQRADYTVSYNENIQAFESLHDFHPRIMLENSGNLFSVDPTLTQGWRHYDGSKNTYYNYTFPSYIELIINPDADITKVFDTIEYKGEVFIQDVDQSTLTFDAAQVMNDHQDSGSIPLTVGQNVVRRLRTWRMNVFRDSKSPRGDARMRDYFLKLILKHTPTMTDFNITQIDTQTNSPYILMYAPGIGKDRKLIGTKATISGNALLSISSGFTNYTFSGEYTIHDIVSDDYIIVDLGFNNIIAGIGQLPTNVVVSVLSNERLVLHDIITTYRYSNN